MSGDTASTTVAHKSALQRFRRAMRRHEKRARGMGMTDLAWTLRTIADSTVQRPGGNVAALPARWAPDARRVAVEYQGRDRDYCRREAGFFEHAADAVTRLRADVAAADAASKARETTADERRNVKATLGGEPFPGVVAVRARP